MTKSGPITVDPKVAEVVLDPKWQAFILEFDGRPMIVLRLVHPRHGALDFAIPAHEAEGMATVLREVKEALLSADKRTA